VKQMDRSVFGRERIEVEIGRLRAGGRIGAARRKCSRTLRQLSAHLLHTSIAGKRAAHF